MDDRQFRREIKLAAFAIGVTLLILATFILLSELGIFEAMNLAGPFADRPR